VHSWTKNLLLIGLASRFWIGGSVVYSG